MDINDIRSIVTLVSFAIFAGILAWAWGSKRRAEFDQAARLPFDDEGEVR
jgi:cytochrome c oxidase cbb3-type subunit IV